MKLLFAARRRAKAPDAARALIEFFASSAVASAIRNTGLEPAHQR